MYLENSNRSERFCFKGIVSAALGHYENTPIQKYRKFPLQKTEKNSDKKLIFFIFLLKTKIMGTRWLGEAVLTNTTIYVYSRNKQNHVYPCKPQVYYIKVEFKGVKKK